jgi:hypothetical protein
MPISASASNHQNPENIRLPPDPETEQSGDELTVGRMGDSITQNIGFTSASGLVPSSVGFTSASALAGQPVSVTRLRSSSPSRMNKVEDCAHTEAEFDSFGSMLNDTSHQPFSMFTSLGKQKKIFQPSAAAMKIAQERAKHWAAEDDVLFREPQDDTPEKTPDVAVFPRQALQAVGNVSPRETSTGQATSVSANPNDISSPHANVAYNVVDLPSLGQAGGGGTFRSAAHFSTPSAPGSRSLQAPSTSGTAVNAFVKPFKSPLLNPSATRNSESSQHTPSRFNSVAFTPTKGPKAVALDGFSGSVSGFSSPMPIRGTPIRKVPAKKFVTPFKLGMRPGEPGHRQLKARNDTERASIASGPSTEVVSSIGDGSKIPTRRRYFDLSMSKWIPRLAAFLT